MTFLTSALSFIFAPFIAVGLMLGTALAPEPAEPTLGASEAIPTTIAFFETTLASAISDTATSFNITSATDKDGTVLASSTYAFVIDEGSSNEEIVIADCTGTVCTNVERGISARTGNTEVTALKKAHRRGASVKMTDAPILMLVSRALRGEDVTDFTPTGGGSLATKDYVDSIALGDGAVPATASDDGIVELATGLQAASSTATDQSGSPLTLHTGISTSTGGTAYTIPVTGSTGKLDSGFIGTTSVTQYAVSYASTTVYTATSTYTKPSNLKFLVVEVQGGGGNGATDGAGGGSGAYARKTYLPSQLSATTPITIGAAGFSTGSSTFGTLVATNGTNASGETGGSAGTATLGDININGQAGFSAQGGPGGHSVLGFGGLSSYNPSGTEVLAGQTGSGYGSGGSGGQDASDGSPNGGAGGSGRPGVVIITEYF